MSEEQGRYLTRRDLFPINCHDSGLTLDDDSGMVGGELNKELDMDKEIQKAFNDSIGAILTYLDEAGVGFATKKAVKSELWELCDKKIKPLGLGESYGTESDSVGNR